MPQPRAILITAFEPSGDALAAGLIAELKRQRPEIVIHALGGPKMAAAGATIIETTTEDAVMLGGAIKHAKFHHQRVKRLKAWLKSNAIDALVPTDSPAANWAICKAVRTIQPRAKIVHLAAPQIWAWASWRIHKLRRLTDHVLCLLPFEPEWFSKHGVRGTFVGHPIFSRPPTSIKHSEPGTRPLRLALLPGSRRGELEKNWPTMLHAAELLCTRHPSLELCIAAASESLGKWLESRSTVKFHMPNYPLVNWIGSNFVPPYEVPPKALNIAVGKTDEILDWADVVLVVSGTATLQVASHRKPMVALYNVSRLTWNLIGRWIVATRTFTLPNLISEADGNGRVIPELVPHFGNVQRVVDEVDHMLRDAGAREKQREGLDRVCAHFKGIAFGERAAGKLLEVIERT